MTPTIPLQTPRGHFHYRAFGPPDGFPLLMLHGWPQSSYCWKPLIPHLRGPFRIICPDLRGLGDSERSPQVEAYLKHELARDIIALLDELGIAECYLVGHDWGGATAQEMAFLIPERIRKLALLNISIIHNVKGNLAARKVLDQMGHYPSWYQYFQQQKRLPEAMIPGNEEVWLRHFLRFSNRQPFPEDAIQEYVRCYRIPGTPTSGANYYRAFRQDIARWQT
ncbi:MAG: alpha/beta hydrolase, partial [Bacteroidetes bacterium]